MKDMSWNKNKPLAMCYVLWQDWECVLDEKDALYHGTAFESLILPFCWKGVSRQ